MARRKSTGAFEDLVDFLALLPWWACIGLAVLSYVALSGVAALGPAGTIVPGQIGQAITQSLWKGLATAGQYLVPIACVAAAIASAARRAKRRSLVAGVTHNPGADGLHGVSWAEFELLVGEAFRLQGYDVSEQGGRGPDGGVDLVLRKDGEKFLVQCKQWKAFKVGVQVVRELFGVMAAEGATGGFVVTSGRFTDDATGFASGRNVTLVDGPKLHQFLRQARAGTDRSPARPAALPGVQPSVAATQASSCPLCSKPMVRRTAKRGANAGGEFWGCTGYPACRGTRPIG